MKNLKGVLGCAGRHLGWVTGMAMGVLLLAEPPPAHALLITPTFDSSITTNVNAVAIEGAVNTAISTIDGLFSNPVTIPVTFVYRNDGNYLASTSESYFYPSYDTYVTLLKADALAHPDNTVLATAIAHLGSGSDANGARRISTVGGELMGLGMTAVPAATITLNSLTDFSFTKPTTPYQYDAIGALEHELDEVLGGGGAGSAINFFYFTNYGPTDLYRYSAPGTPSFTTSSGASSYLSVDGGLTKIVDFNQGPGGDFGDFAPVCGSGGGTGELIQNAFNCMGPYEDYTASSPEFAMMEAIGWDPAGGDPVPEPSTLALLGASLPGLAAAWRWRKS